MKRLSLLIKPASSLCNMRCRYCFYHDISRHREIPSYGIMSRETTEKIIGNIHRDLDEGDEITIAFQGGEPAMAGLPWFENFVASMGQKQKVKIIYALQTNGLLIDEAWAEFLGKNGFLTGLSIDANAGLHNSIRLDTRGRGTFERCLKTKALLDKHKVEYNILCVLTNELASDPDKVWRFILSEEIRFIQFIPCLEGFDEKGASPFALRPARFASFYVRLFYRWAKELEKGSYYSIKLFDDTASFFFRGIPSSCGIDGRCRPQYVVEADAGVYPCDFYALDEHNAGKLTDHTLRELFESPVMQAFLLEKRTLPPICQSCQYLKYCNGGCRRMNRAMYFGNVGTISQGAICGYKMFLDKCLKPLEYSIRFYSEQQHLY